MQAEYTQPIACVFSALPSISCCFIRHGLLSGYVHLDDAAFRRAATTPLTRRPHKHQFLNAKSSSSRHYGALELLFKTGGLRFSAEALAPASRCLTRAVLFTCLRSQQHLTDGQPPTYFLVCSSPPLHAGHCSCHSSIYRLAQCLSS